MQIGTYVEKLFLTELSGNGLIIFLLLHGKEMKKLDLKFKCNTLFVKISKQDHI